MSIRGQFAQAFGFEPDAPIVFFAGRLAAQKRVDDLLNALDLLQYVQPDARTLIAGDGPLRGRLEEMATRIILMDASASSGIARISRA